MQYLPLLCLLLAGAVTCQDDPKAKIPMWTDVYMRGETDWADLDYKLSFLMDTYDIVSLEKCLYSSGNTQDTVSTK